MASVALLGEPGRPHHRPFLIGVSGGTASGKSTVCAKIMELLGQNEVDHHQRKVVIVSQDRFYRVLTIEQKAKALRGQYNFDHPVCAKIMELLGQNEVDHHQRKVVIVSQDRFYRVLTIEQKAKALRGQYNFDHPVLRDMKRGRDLEQILTQYTTFVKPAFEEFCLLTKKYADVIIPRGVDNMVAINLIVQHIQDILNGDICKWQRGVVNGRGLKRALSEQGGVANGIPNPPGKRVLLEPSSRPH
ncbi:UNVERIFIED_CONTAM: hypothetical protein FKN15_044628 [Acipenser sinensis]